MANRCANKAANRILYLRKEAVLREKNIINQATAALRQSVGLLGQFVTVWKSRTGHTHTQTYRTTVTLHARRRVNNVLLTLVVAYQFPIGISQLNYEPLQHHVPPLPLLRSYCNCISL